jgi:hypothetical protein
MPITAITRKDEAELKKTVSPYTYEIASQSTKTTSLVIRAETKERANVKKDVEKKLNKVGYMFVKGSGGSIGTTDVLFTGHTIKISYKPTAGSGGMGETTLNSTITELVPILAFNAGLRYGPGQRNVVRDINQLYKSISESSDTSVYVTNDDQKAGAKFIKQMTSSSKYKEKMEAAMGVLQFLSEKNKEVPIKKLYWGYRSKPKGVPNTHKGDIFVEFSGGGMLGVSVKAGSVSSKEPQLNTYVGKMFDDLGYAEDKKLLIDNVYKKVHATLGLTSDWQERNNKPAAVKTISAFEKQHNVKYEALYDKMLEMIRQAIIAAFNKDLAVSKKYIETQIIKKEQSVPLIVVKGLSKSYTFITDENSIENFLPQVTSITAYASKTSKQNWHIDLKSKDKTITMNMAVRSNAVPPNNKVAQGYNLAIKFNSIKVS